MKRTMYQAARHTPKRKVVSSSLAGGAKNPNASAFGFLFILYSGLTGSAPIDIMVQHNHSFS